MKPAPILDRSFVWNPASSHTDPDLFRERQRQRQRQMQSHIPWQRPKSGGEVVADYKAMVESKRER